MDDIKDHSNTKENNKINLNSSIGIEKEREKENQLENNSKKIQDKNYLVSGHKDFIIYKDSYILKKAKKSEIDFYKQINNQNEKENNLSEKLKALKDFMPKFLGTETINNEEYLMIENLHNGLEAFNNMDCKLGKITWNEKTSEKKIEKRKQMYYESTVHLVGFRIVGAIIRNNKGEIDYKISKKEVSKVINTEKHLAEFFRRFITFENILNYKILKEIINELEKMLEFFLSQNEKCFLCSSLYYVVGRNEKVNVKLIDFAYPEDAKGKNDLNLIEALEENLKIWKSFLN